MRQVTLAAAHRYRRPEWDDARNAEVFGARAHPRYHGHTYVCDVTVEGAINETTGMIADLGRLDAVLKREVHQRFDHRNINLDVPEFGEGKLIPTGEKPSRFIFDQVQKALGSEVRVEEVRLAEDRTLAAVYRG